MENSTVEMAKSIAELLLSSYPNQAHDPATFAKQLTIALLNRKPEDLKALVNPRSGLVANESFLTIAAVNQWFQKRERVFVREFPLLPHIEEEPISPEEREARYRRLKEVAEVIRKTAKAKCVGRPRNWHDTSVNNPEALFKAINSSLHDNHVGVEKDEPMDLVVGDDVESVAETN